MSSFTHRLTCHPATPCAALRAVTVTLTPGAGGDLRLSYRLSGDVANVIVPDPQTPAAADDLWRHTCCEVFIAASKAAAYREFNLSPSGQWAAYDFSAYRVAAGKVAVVPRIAVRRLTNELIVDVVLPGAAVRAVVEVSPSPASTLCLGLSVVVEEDVAGAARQSFWALRHPAAQPDFHHRAGFACELPLAAVSAVA